jgi:hypothetical protein
MKSRISKDDLFMILEEWDRFLEARVRLIACGGTALTIQGLKDSTKDVDFLAPKDSERRRLLGVLVKLGYKELREGRWTRDEKILVDIFPGNRIHTTELLESPLKAGNNLPIRRFKRIYLGALNDYDLVISKLFRGTEVDFEDCEQLIKDRGELFDFERLKARYRETASFDVNPDRMLSHLDSLLARLGRR